MGVKIVWAILKPMHKDAEVFGQEAGLGRKQFTSIFVFKPETPSTPSLWRPRISGSVIETVALPVRRSPSTYSLFRHGLRVLLANGLLSLAPADSDDLDRRRQSRPDSLD
jgi:hypothetical protein